MFRSLTNFLVVGILCLQVLINLSPAAHSCMPNISKKTIYTIQTLGLQELNISVASDESAIVEFKIKKNELTPKAIPIFSGDTNILLFLESNNQNEYLSLFYQVISSGSIRIIFPTVYGKIEQSITALVFPPYRCGN